MFRGSSGRPYPHARPIPGGTPSRPWATVSRVPRVSIVVASLLPAALLVTSAGAVTKPVQATLVGDSVTASITRVPTAEAELRRGVTLRLDAEVCRRLVHPSCVFRGAIPSTAFQAVQGYGRTLGEVLVMHVGYNDSADGYAQGIDRVLRAARSQGVASVVWVTLHETKGSYRRTNLAIEQAAGRWPQIVVVDWNAHSRDKPWFRRDGIHLNDTGARALASFLRVHLLEAVRRTS